MDNINDIISSLSNDDIEMLKGVASSILGENPTNGENSVNAVNSANQIKNVSNAVANVNSITNQLGSLGLNQDDFNMMMKAKSMIDRMNSASSKNADLINALKPHLSEQSRQKADQAIRILKLFEILPYLKDLF